MTTLLAASFSLVVRAQDAGVLSRPDYQNWLFDPAAAIPGVPSLRQVPAVTLIGGGVWAPGASSAPTDGGIQLEQSLIGQPVGPATFWYLAPAPLSAPSRFYDERLTIYSGVDASGRWRNHYLPSGPLKDWDHAVYLRPLTGTGMTLSRQASDGTTVQAGEALPGGQGESVLVFPLVEASGQTLRVEGTVPGEAGRYVIALYPVVRSGSDATEALTPADRWSTNRAAATEPGRWAYDDYLLRGTVPGQTIAIKVTSADFVPFIEVRFLSDEGLAGDNFAPGPNFNLTVEGTAGVPRDYLIRVTTAQAGALGSYRLTVGRQPEIFGFSPAAGGPGTRVRVLGAGFLDGLNPVVDSAWIGGVEADREDPMTTENGDALEIFVPPGAVTGPIRVRASGLDGVSSNAFVVLAPVGDLRREPDGEFSFAVTNGVAGARTVIEATTDVTPPISWDRVATNGVTAPGVWRYRNSDPQTFRQRFYRARME